MKTNTNELKKTKIRTNDENGKHAWVVRLK